MAYWHKFDVPAGTLQASPAEEFVLLQTGVLSRIEIRFPPGCAGLVFFQVFDREHQVYPREPGEAFVGDDWLVDIPERMLIDSEPYGLTLRGWSPDADYDHSVYVHFVVETVRVLRPIDSGFVQSPAIGGF